MSKLDEVTLQRDLAFLRRNQPRNEVAMRICDALEELLRQTPQLLKSDEPSGRAILAKMAEREFRPECPVCAERKKQTRDRVRKFRGKA